MKFLKGRDGLDAKTRIVSQRPCLKGQGEARDPVLVGKQVFNSLRGGGEGRINVP